jgi:hypothetical protein
MSEVPKVPEKCLLDEKGHQTSVDSEAFFDYDDYDDDFIPNNAKGGGGGGGGSNKKSLEVEGYTHRSTFEQRNR